MVFMSSGGIFKFISNTNLRRVVEVLFSSIPGGIIFLIFILGTGILNILSSSSEANNIFAATYLPVVCILPIVIGVIGPLILEKVRDSQTLSLRGSVIVSFISALGGSFMGSLLLVITGLVSEGFRPFGDIFDPIFGGAPGLLIAFMLIVVISTVLSTIGGAIISVLLNRAGN